jgi:hypothetical protein
MALDPNIILQAQPTVQLQNPLDVAAKAMSMKALANQQQLQGMQIQQSQNDLNDQQSLRDAFKNNVKTDASGNPSLDKQGVLSDLYKSGNPKSMDYSQLWASQDLEKFKQQSEIAKQLAWSVRDEGTYQAVRQKAMQLGLPNAQMLPPNYDPSFVQNWQMHSLEGDKQADLAIKQQDTNIKKQELDVKRQELDLNKKKAFGASGAPVQVPPDGKIDPAILVPSRVPEHHQAKAFGEIEAAQNTAQNAPAILKAFDDAANNMHAVDLVPGTLNKDQKALHTLLGPTFKDVEGTVRQAAMDNLFSNITPQTADGGDTKATKRAALVNYLQSKSSAPTAKAYGIDLKKFPSTSISQQAAGGNQAQAIDFTKMSDEAINKLYNQVGGK